MRVSICIGILAAAVAASGCSKNLRELDARRNSADEFLVLPGNALEAPADYAALPEPTPGGSNRTDRNPSGEAIAALGGRATSGAGVPATDGALVTAASRFGVQNDIRASLAEEDAAFRKRGSILANIKLFPVDRYAEVYERQTLDPERLARAYRRAGIPVPSANLDDF